MAPLTWRRVNCLPDSYVKSISQAKTNDCDTINPFCWRSSLHLQCVQIYECNQLHRYILCVVVVIVCNEHWEQDIQIELTCGLSCFPCSPNQCQHRLNYIHIPCPELSCFTVTVFQNFRFECVVSTVYVSKQQMLLDHSIIIV